MAGGGRGQAHEQIARQIVVAQVAGQRATHAPLLRLAGRHAAVVLLGEAWRAFFPGMALPTVVLGDDAAVLVAEVRSGCAAALFLFLAMLAAASPVGFVGVRRHDESCEEDEGAETESHIHFHISFLR